MFNFPLSGTVADIQQNAVNVREGMNEWAIHPIFYTFHHAVDSVNSFGCYLILNQYKLIQLYDLYQSVMARKLLKIFANIFNRYGN